jgi:tripartite-type tricarboxylate transporter receptor subunit TctC
MFPCKKEVAALMLAASAVPLAASACGLHDPYPQRQLTLVLGYPPGGGMDVFARLFAQHMQEDLGQKIVIDFRPGASGNIGAESVARATPDGYTLFIGARPNTIHKTMFADMKFDFSRDLAPVGLLASTPYVLVAAKDSGIGSVPDLLALAQASPGKLSYASSGVGTASYLLTELLQQKAGIELLHVPYRGDSTAFADVIGGRVSIYMAPLPAALPQVAARKVQALAVMSAGRAASLPDVPAITEHGLDGLQGGSWYGLMAPGGTPPEVLARLNQSVNAVLQKPALQASYARLSYVMPRQPSTPDMLAALIAEETEKWTAILRERGFQSTP